MPQPRYRARYRLLTEDDKEGYSGDPQPLALAVQQARCWIDSSKAPAVIRGVMMARLAANPMERIQIKGRMLNWEQWVEEAP